MSKKDYELIARVLRDAIEERAAVVDLPHKFAWAIHEHDNRLFNIERFLRACGVNQRSTHNE